MGPVYDPVTEKFTVIENSLSEGSSPDKIATLSSVLVGASYSRAIATADGGAKTKYIFSAMQSVQLDKKGSNCNTKRFIYKLLTEENYKSNIYRFIIDDKKKQIVRLDYDNKSEYINKVVKMRSVLYCEGDKYCNICAGDYYYELGITNIGPTVTKISSVLLNKALKNMHDISVKTSSIDIFKNIRSA
jgi:hypothetical protein